MQIDQLEQRLKKLWGKRSADVFILDSGETFEVANAFEWLLLNGVNTPHGRIVAYRHPDNADPLSMSIYETIDAMIGG